MSNPDHAASSSSSSGGLPNVQAALGLHSLTAETRAALARAGYEVKKELSTGASATVFRGVERATRRPVALKVITNPEEKRAQQQFERERQVLCAEGLPSAVVRYLTSVEGEDHQPVLVLELIEGSRLRDHAKQCRLGVGARLELAEELLGELQRLHDAGFLHVDPSWNNVMIDGEGRIRFIDFGQACEIDPRIRSPHSLSGGRGTVDNATRRVLAGDRPTVPDDVRAAGATIYHLLVGEPPKRLGGDPRRDEAHWTAKLEAGGVPGAPARTLARALRERDPDREPVAGDTPSRDAARDGRFGAASELAGALRSWRRGREVTRRRLKTAVAVLLFLLPAAGLAWRNWTLYEEERAAVDTRRLAELEQEAQLLPNLGREAIATVIEEARQLTREHDRLLETGATREAGVLFERARAAYAHGLELSRSLAAAEPVQAALGEVLARTPWVAVSPAIRTRLDSLERRYSALRKDLDAGVASDAMARLRALQADMAALAEDNVHARTAEDVRLAFERLEAGTPDRLLDHEDFRVIQARADGARRLLEAGTFQGSTGAIVEYGRACELLKEFLDREQTEEERIAPLQRDADRLLVLERERHALEEERTRIAGDLAEAQTARDQARGRVDELEEAERLWREEEARLTAELSARDERIAVLSASELDLRTRLQRSEQDARDYRLAAESSSPDAAARARKAAEARAAEALDAAFATDDLPAALDEVRASLVDLGIEVEPAADEPLARARELRTGVVTRILRALDDFEPWAPALEPLGGALHATDAVVADVLEALLDALEGELETLDPGETPVGATTSRTVAVQLYDDLQDELRALDRVPPMLPSTSVPSSMRVTVLPGAPLSGAYLASSQPGMTSSTG